MNKTTCTYIQVHVLVFLIYFHVKQVFTQEECPDGSTLILSQCVPCPSRCLTCKSRDHCTSCRPTYWDIRQNQVCNNDCPSSCATDDCDDQTGHCKQCSPGYYGDICQYSCDTCEAGICSMQQCVFGCKERYYNLTNYRGITVCEQCTDGCLRCDADGCTRCEEGYYLTRSSYGVFCKKCGHYCTQCDSNKCTECVDGRYGDHCDQFCSVPNCQTCSSRSTPTAHVCHTCNPGFVLRDGKCICSPNCVGYCTTDGACQGRCMDGYSGIYCNKTCHSTCKTCDILHEYKCTQCFGNVYGIQCDKACSKGCSRADTNQACQQLDGTCSHGCILGRYGRTCDYKCPSTCKYEYCRQYEGTCVYGCSHGYSGPRCRHGIYDGTEEVDSYSTYPTREWMSFSLFTTRSPTFPSSTTSSVNDTNSPASSNNVSPLLFIGIGIGLVVIILVIILFVWFCIKSRRRSSSRNQSNAINQSANYSHERAPIPNPRNDVNGDVSNDVMYDYTDVKGDSLPTDANGYLELTPMQTRDVNVNNDDTVMPKSNIQIYVEQAHNDEHGYIQFYPVTHHDTEKNTGVCSVTATGN
ncbi:hypothetical protein ACF0H5_023835 [Mactra antiquata]